MRPTYDTSMNRIGKRIQVSVTKWTNVGPALPKQDVLDWCDRQRDHHQWGSAEELGTNDESIEPIRSNYGFNNLPPMKKIFIGELDGNNRSEIQKSARRRWSRRRRRLSGIIIIGCGSHGQNLSFVYHIRSREREREKRNWICIWLIVKHSVSCYLYS